MDRVIVYAGQQPLETHVLQGQKNAMLGIGDLASGVLGPVTVATGFALSAGSGLTMDVAPGCLYALKQIDGSAYSSLGTDSGNVIKQGRSPAPHNLSFPAPGTAGQSIAYLVQVAFTEADTGSIVLPYYNSANPSVAYAGPGGSGTAQPVSRDCTATVTVKAGTAASTGSQVPPSPDAGNSPLWVVTVANGASSLSAANVDFAANSVLVKYTIPQAGDQLAALIADVGIKVNPADSSQVVSALRTKFADAARASFGQRIVSSTGTAAALAAPFCMAVSTASPLGASYVFTESDAATIDPTVSGIGGIAGTAPSSGDYLMAYLVRNPSNGDIKAYASKLSGSVNMSPYTQQLRVGFLRYAGSNRFYSSLSHDDEFQFIEDGTNGLPLVKSGTDGDPSAGTYVAVSLASHLPAVQTGLGRTKVRLQFSKNSASPTKIALAPSANYGAYNTTKPPLYMQFGTNAVSDVVEFLAENTTPNVYYASDETNTYLRLLGFSRRLPPYEASVT